MNYKMLRSFTINSLLEMKQLAYVYCVTVCLLVGYEVCRPYKYLYLV